MVYKEFQGIRLSALGMGCMRLPVIGGDDAKIDKEQTAAMVDLAMSRGVNYYDTAYGYHSGNSELVIGECLRRYPRESYYIADKFPGYDRKSFGKAEEIFEEQLKKTGMEYFDFYLFHNVCELNIKQYLDDAQYHTYEYLIRQKRNGRIRHLGASFHGDLPVMEQFLEAYGKDIEFAQIQLNWMDWTFQQAKEKVELLDRYGIPVWVMEPLRGGSLVKLDTEDEQRLKELRPQETVPAWSFRFLQTLPSVTVTLSGMSDLQQMKDNLDTYETDAPLDEEERKALQEIADKKIRAIGVPCTGCHYCVPHCTQGLDIPYLISLYNEHLSTKDGDGFLAPMALAAIPKDLRPSACIGCCQCLAVCPQNINIPTVFIDFKARVKNA